MSIVSKADMSILGPIIGQSALAFFYRCAGAVVTFCFGIIFARIMKVEEYGVLMSLMSFGLIAATIGGLGQQTLLLREMPKQLEQRSHAALAGMAWPRLKVVWAGAGAATVLAGLVFLAGHDKIPLFGRWDYMTSLLLIIPLAIIDMQSSAGRALASMHLAIGPKDVFWRFLMTAIGAIVFFATAGRQLTAANVFWIGIVTLAVLIVVQRRYIGRLAKGARLFARPKGQAPVAVSLRASLPFWVTSVVNILFPTMDLVIVAAVTGPEIGAYYYAANRVALLLDFFMSAFAVPAAPCIARWHDAGQHDQITEVASTAALLAFASVLVTLIALVFVGDWVLRAFGEAFVRSYGILLLLGCGQLGSAYLGVGSPALDMTGHQKVGMVIMAATSMAGLIIMIGVTWGFGVWGAAAIAATLPLVMKAAMALYLYGVDGIDITGTTKSLELLTHLKARASVLGRK